MVERLEPESSAVEEPLEAPKRPVGKAARAPKPEAGAVDTASAESDADTTSESEPDTDPSADAADETAADEFRMVEHRPAGRGLVAA